MKGALHFAGAASLSLCNLRRAIGIQLQAAKASHRCQALPMPALAQAIARALASQRAWARALEAGLTPGSQRVRPPALLEALHLGEAAANQRLMASSALQLSQALPPALPGPAFQTAGLSAWRLHLDQRGKNPVEERFGFCNLFLLADRQFYFSSMSQSLVHHQEV